MTDEPAPAPAPVIESLPSRLWQNVCRFPFRLAFVYFVLYAFPFPLNQIPWQLASESLATGLQKYAFGTYAEGMDHLVRWVDARWLHWNVTVGPAGSGDTTWNYVQQLCFGVVTVAVALLWTLLACVVDWSASAYARLHDWLRCYVRFYLAVNMLGYGLAKVIKTQFQTPGLDALMQPFGDGSPMGLLWNFMGFSDAYCIFVGAAEVLSGLLLIARRTTTLGSLFAVAVMSNVAMLNFCFDTPVKLFSVNLLAMGMFLAIPDAKKLFDVFVLHRPPRHEPLRPLFRSARWHWSAVAFRTLLIGWIAWSSAKFSWQIRHTQGELAAKPPLYGTWEVEVFEVDDELVPEDAPGSVDRWTKVRIGYYRLSIEHRGGLTEMMFARAIKRGEKFDLASAGNSERPLRFVCELTDPDTLSLDGKVDGKQLHVELGRRPDDYFLTNRGFHWINEYPLNR